MDSTIRKNMRAPEDSSDPGYYRYPTVWQDHIVFNAEDDLWTVSKAGGQARRLTAGLGPFSRALFSPDGRHLAFLAREEGETDVYIMPAAGGEIHRLTYTGGALALAGFDPAGHIVFSTAAKSVFPRAASLYSVSVDGGEPTALPWGPAAAIAYGPRGQIVLGRNTADPARWKRYQGGTAGEFWIDIEGHGQFERLTEPRGNLASPMWVGSRLYFLSDHEGIGNLYSIRPSVNGNDLRRHTDHSRYYARNASTDGETIVYHAGADLYLFNPAEGTSRPIAVDFRSQRTQRERKFVDAAHFLNDYAPHPSKPEVLITTRGQLFQLGTFDGPVRQMGQGSGVRHRLAQYVNRDGDRVIAFDDSSGEERLVRLSKSGLEDPEELVREDFGRPLEMAVDPTGKRVAIATHRLELWVVDLPSRTARQTDHSDYGRIGGLAWSPDGRFLAYQMANSQRTTAIKILDAETGVAHTVTRPVLHDTDPAWDPEGRYLYFLSYRTFDPVYDNLQFDLGFPRGVRPYLITLTAKETSPFLARADSPAPSPSADAEPDHKDPDTPSTNATGPKEIRIDFDGIEERVLAFPVREGKYGQIAGLGKKVLWTLFPVKGALSRTPFDTAPAADGVLEAFDFDDQRHETLIAGLSDFKLSADRKTLIYRAGHRLRSVKAGEKAEEKSEGYGKKSGYLDWRRIPVLVEPMKEWAQMLREAWRLMRDNFWTADMSGVDWADIYEQYRALLPRITTRGEFSDLMWEMQGELGTSHAYEMGGDYRETPSYPRGSLAADFTWDKEQGGWRITHIVNGDPSGDGADSPLNTPGANVSPGDVLLAIDGLKLTPNASPDYALTNKKNREVLLTVTRPGTAPRSVVVKTLGQEQSARYREWVHQNRQWVHDHSEGRVGYIHVPDMGPRGYAEFHRGFLAEVEHEALIVDVRYNGGGHVSPLILEKLNRRRLGYDVPRWGLPEAYPAESPRGPIVALTNEGAGSDGDIFSHAFKMLGLGPLVGKRTWGGVIGIWARHPLVDGSITTQPEFSFWFKDVGWGVENYGTDPTIPVENRPQDYRAGKDPQLERSLTEALGLLEKYPADGPPNEPRPSRAIPQLPRR